MGLGGWLGKVAELPGVSSPGARQVPAVGPSSHLCGQGALLINANPEEGLVTRMTASSSELPVEGTEFCQRRKLLLELSLKLSVLCSKRLQNLVV